MRLQTALVVLLTFGCATVDSPQPSVPVNLDGIPKYEAGGPIKAAGVISRVQPQTSSEFRRKYDFAEAKVEAVVNEEGRVVATGYVSGNPEWAQILAQAVALWKFEPATLDGKPITVRFEITSTFRRNR